MKGQELFRSIHSQDCHTAQLSPESHSQLGTHEPVWVPYSSTKHPIHDRGLLPPPHARRRNDTEQHTNKKNIYRPIAPGNFRSSPGFNCPKDPQPPETWLKERWAMFLRLSKLWDFTNCCNCIYPSRRTGSLIRNSVRRGRGDKDRK